MKSNVCLISILVFALAFSASISFAKFKLEVIPIVNCNNAINTISIKVNQTMTDLSCPVGICMNFTYTLNRKMDVHIELTSYRLGTNYDLYVKWDGTCPTTIDYDEKSANVMAPDSVWKDSLHTGTYYFMVFCAQDLLTGVFDVTLYGCVSPSVHNLDTNLDYLSIQKAIDAPETLGGHTIFIEKGTYNENILMNKSLLIVGETRDTTVVKGDLKIVNSTNITIRTLSLKPSYGVLLNSTENSTIEDVFISDCQFGIRLQNSNSNTISHNLVADCNLNIAIELSDNNILIDNTLVKGKEINLYLWRSSNNTIVDNIIFSAYIPCGWSSLGLGISRGGNNTFSGNVLTSSKSSIASFGIIINSSDNFFYNNLIENYDTGLRMDGGCDNRFFCNNFVNNDFQVQFFPYYVTYDNVWDNGLEGNYWSNYNGTDSNHDGIGDTPHTVCVYPSCADNIDNYPLMGPFSSFNTFLGKHINVISNSTIEDFQYLIQPYGTTIRRIIMMYVSNMTVNQTFGFCRICIPRVLINGEYRVFVNGTEISYDLLPFSNSTLCYLYFTYYHSTQEIIIIPDFPSFLILPLFMIATLLTALAFSRKSKVY